MRYVIIAAIVGYGIAFFQLTNTKYKAGDCFSSAEHEGKHLKVVAVSKDNVVYKIGQNLGYGYTYTEARVATFDNVKIANLNKIVCPGE